MAAADTLGTRIRRARERKRWNQQQLADEVDVHVKTISNWETGTTVPRNRIGALEEALGVSLEEEPGLPDIVARNQHDPQVIEIWSLTSFSEQWRLDTIERYLASGDGPWPGRQHGTALRG